MNGAVVDNGISEHSLNSWREFGQFIQDSHANSPAFIYRGQTDASWKIQSSLDRHEARFPVTPNYGGSNPEVFQCPPATRNVHLEAFKEAVRGKRGPNPQDIAENEWWALAQHHGLATPLLDWTYSPFVALFFAFEEVGCIDWNSRAFSEPKDRVVYVAPFHLITGNGTNAHPAPTVFSVRREVTNRLSSQSGLLMKMPPRLDLESSVRSRFQDETTTSNPHARAILTRITIPNSDRQACLKFLNKMNINRMALFPDLDGAAKYINSLWELDFDTALGALPDGTTPPDTPDCGTRNQ